MLGVVLMAGTSQRLRPLTDDIPKALLPVDGTRVLCESALEAFAAVGIRDVVLVVGYAAERVAQRVPQFEARYGVQIQLVHNDKAAEWNNCYSLWLARDFWRDGAIVANGDTWHPADVERTLLPALGDVRLAVDTAKTLGDEEMKVMLHGDCRVRTINKKLDVSSAQGEYIGVSYVSPVAAPGLAAALEETWRRDPSLYYEDGFQTYIDSGNVVTAVPIGTVDWVEVDTADDLVRARELAQAVAR